MKANNVFGKQRRPMLASLSAVAAGAMLLCADTEVVYSQGMGINNATPDASSLLDLTSTTKGLLIPRMTIAQRGAIVSPATSLLIYQTDGTAGYYYNSGTPGAPVWSLIAAGTQPWTLSGSNIYQTTLTDNVGIGTTSPTSILHTVASGAKTAAYIGNALTNTATSSTASITKTGLDIQSTGTWNGASAVNTGLNVNVSGGTTNYAAIFQGGNVGIGTAGPQAKLDVSGDIKMGNSSAVCNASTEGSQRYNSTTKIMEYCNGTSWLPISSGDVFPTGTVIYVNAATCPAGWTEMVAAQGRYIVGLPAAGSLAGTAGTALSNKEDRAVGQHNHGISDPGHSHSYNGSAFGGAAPRLPALIDRDFTDALNTNTATTGILINNAGTVAGTNAPYIQLRVCQKN